MPAEADVKSARRVVDIFLMFSELRRPAALNEISKRLELPKSSCLALLRTLESNGFLYRFDEGGMYYPTRRMHDVSAVITDADPLLGYVHARLQALSRETGETVLFAKRVGHAAHFLDVVQSSDVLRYVAGVGDMRPLHVGASGQSLLASMEPGEADALIDALDMDKRTPQTITSRRQLKQTVREARQRGWVYSEGGNLADIGSVGSFVRINGEAYSIAVGARTQRLERRVEKVARLVKAVCEELSRAGGRG